MNTELIQKIQKLLNLSQSSNEHEAAQAMKLAMILMEKHNISEAMLNTQSTEADEVVQDWQDPLYASNEKNRSQWRGALATVLANHNACVIWTFGPDIKIGGRASDVQTVRYLFNYCMNEIDRLAKKYAGNGKSWLNNYRLGCVSGINTKLDEGKQQARHEAIVEYGQAATTASVKVDEKAIATTQWFEKYSRAHNFGLRGYGRQSHSADARRRGQEDGRSINLGGSKELGGSVKKLPSR